MECVEWGLDLLTTVGFIVALSGLLMGLMMKSWNIPVLLSVILGLLLASTIGMVTGFLITGFDLPPFIATLGMMSIERGAAYSITGGDSPFTPFRRAFWPSPADTEDMCTPSAETGIVQSFRESM